MHFRDENTGLPTGNLLMSWLVVLLLWGCSTALLAKNSENSIAFPPAKYTASTAYGPVISNEGLWDIADKLRINEEISTAQMAVALFKHNPEAFYSQNMNSLLVGSILIIPSKADINALSKSEAFELLTTHWQQWQYNKNQKLANATEPHFNSKPALLDEFHTESPTLPESQRIATESAPLIKKSNQSETELVDSLYTKSINTIKDIKNSSFFTDMSAQESSISEVPETKISANEMVSVVADLEKKQLLTIGLIHESVNKENKTNSSLTPEAVDISFINYIQHIEFRLIFNQIKKSYHSSMQWGIKNLDTIVLKLEENPQFKSSPVLIASLVLVIFILLVLLFRRQDNNLDLLESDSKEVNCQGVNSNNITKDNSIKDDKSVDDIIFTRENHSHTILEQSLEKNAYEGDGWSKKSQTSFCQSESNSLEHDVNIILDNQVNINKFIKPESDVRKTSALKKRSGKSVLEDAFSSENFFTGTGFIKETPGGKTVSNAQKILDAEQTDSDIRGNLLDSTEEIRMVNQETRDSKINAFFHMTQSEKLSGESLTNELSLLKSNEKLDVFIEEFEQIMFSLSEQNPDIVDNQKGIENLIQFKLSIHFIKVLSEMMQARYLNHFSNTVIDFLEEVISGKSHLTIDVSQRLSIVVCIYNNYINKVKAS